VADVIHPTIEYIAVAVRGLTDVEVLPLVLSRACAGGRVELEQHIAVLGAVHEHHSAAADAAHLRVDHSLDEGARDRRIDRIAAAPHDLEADLGRGRLRADDDRHTKRVRAAT